MTKRIDETLFNGIKWRINRFGRAEAHRKMGYSISTIRSIDLAQDYDSWRTNRKTVAKATKKQSTAQVDTQPTLVHPIAPSKSPLAYPVEPLATTIRPGVPAADYVTKEDVEVAFRNMWSKMNRRLKPLEDHVEEVTQTVDKIERAEEAFADAHVDEPRKSLWQRLMGRF